MRHGSLESGIGMFDYAAEMMGWENVFHCEKEEFCQTILKYYWPKAKSYANVFGFNGYEWRGKVDIMSAGFPCQPFSNAGKRKGSEDDRHIWPENMRIFREAQPAFIVCENVPGLVTIEDGMVFEQVCTDLENEGYEVQTFIIPAVATDKDHRRDRIWIIGYNKAFRINTNSNCCRLVYGEPKINTTEAGEYAFREFEQCITNDTNSTGERLERSEVTGQQPEYFQYERYNSNDTNTEGERLERCIKANRSKRAQPYDKFTHGCSGKRNESWLEAATRLCTMDDGSTGRLDLTAISKSKWRTESLKAAGNTIAWEIAYEFFKTIEETIKIIQ